MTPKLSIAAIAYNNEEYVDAWIDSIYEQDVSFDVELVVTDDCSTDNTVEKILKGFEKLESKGIRCRLYHNEQNSGVGPTRHNSLMNCEGEYVLFLDGDDRFFGSHSFESIVSEADRFKSDCVIFGTLGASYGWACGGTAKEIVRFDDRAACAAALNRNIAIVVWDKLWRREVIKNVEYLQLRSNEDTTMTPIWLYNCKNIIQVPIIGYYYNNNPKSLTHTYTASAGNTERRKVHLKCLAKARKYMTEFFLKNDRELLELCYKWYY